MIYTTETKTSKPKETSTMKNKIKKIDKEVGILYTLYRVLLSSLK